MKNSEAAAKLSGKSILPPIRGSVFPEIRVCMEEQDFHVNIIKGKKKVIPFFIQMKFNKKPYNSLLTLKLQCLHGFQRGRSLLTSPD